MLLALFAPLAMNGQTSLLTENFDGMSSISTDYSSTGWYAYNAGNGNNWELSSSNGTSTSKCAQYHWNSSNAANCYLVSSPFNVSSNMSELSVSLYEKVGSDSWTESFEVFFVKAGDFSSAAGVASATKYTAIASDSYSNTNYAEKTGSTTNSALKGQSVRVVVHCTSEADKYYLYIDDIVVTETTSGGGGSSYITEINNDNDWNDFAQSVRNGLDYSSKTVNLNANISINSLDNLAGTSSNPFKGSFNGNGNTITLDITTTEGTCAPFHTTQNATFQNLVIDGTINTSSSQAGGLIGIVHNGCSITNCISKVTINSSLEDKGVDGGFIAQVEGGNVTITGCVFAGSLLGSSTKGCGGFVGWSSGHFSPWAQSGDATIVFTDCLFAPISVTMDPSYWNNFAMDSPSATFARGFHGGYDVYNSESNPQQNYCGLTFNNCYYTQAFGTQQGTCVYSVTGQSPVTVAMSGSPLEGHSYNVSGLNRYSTGITLTTNNNTTIYAASEEALSLTLNGSGAGYLASTGSLSGSDNPYTLTMTTSNSVISAIPAHPASIPYIENFENGQNGWEFANGEYTNHWTIGTATSVSSSHSLYVTNGTANEYNTGSESYVYAYRELNFTAAGDYVVSFKWMANGENGCYDAMYAALVPQGTACPPSSNITSSTNQLPSDYINASNASTAFLWKQSSWQTSTKTVSIPSAGIYTLVFYWKNDSSGGTNPPAAVDDIEIHVPPITEITSVADWNEFCNNVKNGRDYSGEIVTMTADISITSQDNQAGSDGKLFKGIFDGNGHTINVNMTATGPNCAPFYGVQDATIKNLVVTGSITSEYIQVGGLCGIANGNTTFNNCLSSVAITSTCTTTQGDTYGWSTCGGFVGASGGSANPTFVGCAFTGSLTASRNGCGGFIGFHFSQSGWGSDYGGRSTYTNCLCAPSSINITSSESAVFSCGYNRGQGVIITAGTGYYNEEGAKLNTKQGTRVYSVKGQSPVTVAMAGELSTQYTVSGIKVYSPGITLTTTNNNTTNTTIYAASGKTINLTLGGGSDYEADNGNLEGSGSSYTLTMAASNTVISSGISCAAPTNLRCDRYTPTSATLSWTRGGDETQWHVQCWSDPAYEDQPYSRYADATSNTYVLDQLTEGTTYSIKVRAVCDNDNDVCSDWSNTITVTPGTMKFIFTNNSGSGDSKWDTPTNWSPVGLPTIDDDVEIRANATIRSGYTALANEISFYTNPSTGDPDGSITIEDGGQLQHNNEDVVVTVKRYIAPYGSANLGYKIISFPVSGIYQEDECIEGLLTANPYDFYTFDYNNLEENVYLEWVHVSNNDVLDPYKGFLYASQNGTTISVKGVVAPSVNQNHDLDYVEGVAPFNGWQLVGNPFVCNAYLTANGGNLDFYEIEDDAQAGYAEFVLNDNTVAIPPMGGVMVWLHDDDNLVYSRTAPSKGPGILNMDVNKASMRGTTMLDRARVRFGEGRNLKKLQLNPRHTKLYIPEDGNDFSVYYAEGAGTIPVNFKAQDNGSYTLSFSTEDVSFNYLHLIDNMNGNDVDLLQTPYYTFDAKSTDFASRFTLVFATGNDNDGNFAFFNNGVWIINNPSTVSGAEATLQVVDVLGHILSSETISGSCSKAINVAPGVYMLRLVNGNDVKVQKIVVR